MTSPSPFDLHQLSRLATWWSAHAQSLVGSIVAVEIATAGRSNVTAALTSESGSRAVIRRPPFGNLLPTAHDVGREGRIMASLAESDVPVPAVVGICEDVRVIGAPFVVMAYVEGLVLDTASDALAIAEGERASLTIEIARHLAALQLDPLERGLGTLARPTGFVDRQLVVGPANGTPPTTRPRRRSSCGVVSGSTPVAQTMLIALA